MKFILKIGVAISLLASVFVSCTEDEIIPSGIDLNVDKIAIAPIGGTHSVNVSSVENWTATASEPWIYVSPTNGTASTACKISIDSTHLSEMREGVVVFRTAGVEREIAISQDGFPKEVTVDNDVFALPSFADYDEQYFEISVTTNVPFNIEYTDDDASTWLSYEEFDLGLNANYRPRTTTIRFDWETNTRAKVKLTDIKFVPISEEDVDTDVDVVGVSQEAAEEIIPSRKGDSLSIIAINRSIRVYAVEAPAGSSMVHWPNVKLWTRSDIKRAIEEEKERSEPDLDRIEAIKGFEGRVRVVSFFLFETDEALPYEVQFFDAAEEVSFRSNVSHQKYSLSLGEYITKLTYLRRLTVFAYGITTIPESMTNMKRLEYLDLAANLFDSTPSSIINKYNFPDMKVLDFAGCRRVDFVPDMTNPGIENPGLKGFLPVEWLTWSGLEYLNLANNFYEGAISDLVDMYGMEFYTEDDDAAKKNPKLIGTPIVLPDCVSFSLNLNRLSGKLPVWLLEHPNLKDWNPDILVYNQEGIDSAGKDSGFTNVPL